MPTEIIDQAETTAKKGKQKTEYIVLVLESEVTDHTFTIVGRARGNNSEEAIRGVVSTLPSQDGVYAAVPARSWQPVTITTTTETRLTLNPAN